WPRHQEDIATASFDRSGRGGAAQEMILLANTTPSARANVASRLFSMRAATPPPLRRGKRAPSPSRHSWTIVTDEGGVSLFAWRSRQVERHHGQFAVDLAEPVWRSFGNENEIPFGKSF